MTIDKRLASLRSVMIRCDIQAYIISGSDPHNNEYLPDAWKIREWISGFTGSAGTIVVTLNHAGLWTDSRYFIQAEKQFQDNEFELHRLGMAGTLDYPMWLINQLPQEAKVGIDGYCFSENKVKELARIFALKNIHIVELPDLFGELWIDRPLINDNTISILSPDITGKTTKDKLEIIANYIKDFNASALFLSSLDEIAWLFNIRGSDVPFNPVAVSYAFLTPTSAHLFIKPTKITREIETELNANGITLHDYYHIGLFIDELSQKETILVDSNTLNSALYKKLAKKATLIEAKSPITLLKSIKNPTEIEGFKTACIKDGVAMTRFLYWLTHSVKQQQITECDASDKLTQIRAEGKDYICDSFGNISAYGSNAALPHYSAKRGEDRILEAKGLYLIDSGGQYKHGTTDITRTIPLGPISEQEREDYTLVLKGMIALTTLHFPLGTKGYMIDCIARQFLWRRNKNYGHGTGHGIGHYLNVHEGPQAIRPNVIEQELLAGMVTSNEPGIYIENQYGIRHENMILCEETTRNQFGQWLGFETLTLCYFDTTALAVELLTPDEVVWLNQYHSQVYNTLSPYLSESERKWLKEKTDPIIR